MYLCGYSVKIWLRGAVKGPWLAIIQAGYETLALNLSWCVHVSWELLLRSVLLDTTCAFTWEGLNIATMVLHWKEEPTDQHDVNFWFALSVMMSGEGVEMTEYFLCPWSPMWYNLPVTFSTRDEYNRVQKGTKFFYICTIVCRSVFLFQKFYSNNQHTDLREGSPSFGSTHLGLCICVCAFSLLGENRLNAKDSEWYLCLHVWHPTEACQHPFSGWIKSLLTLVGKTPPKERAQPGSMFSWNDSVENMVSITLSSFGLLCGTHHRLQGVGKIN